MRGAGARGAALCVVVVVLVLTALGAPGRAAAPEPREPGDTRVFSRVLSPGFPAYVHVHPGNRRVYAGTYTDPNGDAIASRVFEWTRRGALLRSWEVPGQDLAEPHGVQVATSDADGRLVLLEKSTARVLTLDVRTGRFRRVATLPDLEGGHAIPNYATWGPKGALFVSDYGQPVIWRIPPGGGKPSVWFTDDALASPLGFGTTGLVFDPATRSLVISQQSTGDPLDLLRGHLYRLPLRKGGAPGSLETLWTSGPLDLPDGFGIARSGTIYVALLGTNQIVGISPDGEEVARFGTPVIGENGSPIPFDTPSNATFAGKRLLVANQSALTATPANHAILDVYVGERGIPMFLPQGARLR